MARLSPPSHNALVVRPHIAITAEEREEVLRSVEYNVFAFPAALLTCDYLSDSGTSAMTDVQWAAMLRGDESYGRNSGYYCLLEAFRDVFERGNDRQYAFRDVLAGTADSAFYRDMFLKETSGGFVNGGPLQLIRPNFFILPQGRCAEALLFSTMKDTIQAAAESRDAAASHPPALISNGFFDTTGANAAANGFQLHTFTQPGLTDAFPAEQVGKSNPFKGNLDIEKTAAFLSEEANARRVSMLLLTITNNWAGAQPVSMANIAAAAALAREHAIPFFFDACRFAENAKFIQDFEDGYGGKTIPEIVREMFSFADGFTISLKKDGLANMGGALCFRDEGAFPARFGADVGIRLKERQIMCYGNDSYGGMSGRDVMAAAVGLYEVTKETYLADRIGLVRRFAQGVVDAGVPVLLPPGGHAIYLDMDGFFAGCGRSYGEFASVGFTLELLKDYGIRACEAGPFGWEWDKKGAIAQDRDSIPNLVRFAVPRYVMSDRHIEYTVAAISELHARRHTIPGVRITRGKELRMRVFQSGLEPVPVAPPKAIGSTQKRTYLSEATHDVKRLHSALDLGDKEWELLQGALDVSMQGWGHLAVPDKPIGWLSDASLNLCPFEYSVATEQNTGEAQLRFLIEAQADEPTLEAHQLSALKLTNDIRSRYPDIVSLDRFQAIQTLFLPDADAQGTFAAWHSFAVGDNSQPEWKIYLNANASGPSNSTEAVRTAFNKLGMADAWALVERILSSNDKLMYMSLDLQLGAQARVKIYVQHEGIDACGLAAVARSVAPESASEAEIRRFCKTLSGGSEGPYKRKGPMTCFGFTAGPDGTGVQAEAAVYFPVHNYAADDAEVNQRLLKFLSRSHDGGGCSKVSKTYERIIEALARRPLEDGRGIHAWVGLKMTKGRGSVVTFYLASEMFGSLPRI